MKKILLSLAAAVIMIAASAQQVKTGDAPVSQNNNTIKLLSFSGTLENNKVLLNWAISSNETTDRFEVERSTDNLNFNTAALVFTSEKSGNESYKYFESPSFNGKIYYRLKIYEGQAVSYSKVITFAK